MTASRVLRVLAAWSSVTGALLLASAAWLGSGMGSWLGGNGPAARSGRRAADQRAEAGQRIGAGPVIDPDAALVTIQQAAFMQHLQMMTDRRLRQVERVSQVADACFAARMRGHQGHQPQSYRVSQCLQQRRDLLGLRSGQRLAGQRLAAPRQIGWAQHSQRLRHASILTDPYVPWQARRQARYRRLSKSSSSGGSHAQPRAARTQRQ